MSDQLNAIQFLKTVLPYFGLGYFITFLCSIVSYLMAFQCKSVDGLTNLAFIIEPYMWIFSYIFVGFFVSLYYLMRENK